MILSPRHTRALKLAICLAAVRGVCAATPGLDEVWAVGTGVPDALQTQTITLSPEFTGVGAFQYDLGFGTFETVGTGFLFDSLTIALSKGDGTQSTILATADVFGLTIAPLSPGGLLSDGGLSVRETLPRGELLNGAPMTFAYTLQVTLPPALLGQELQTTFSFFNNDDAVETRAYAMAVPEPATFALLAMAAAILVLRSRACE